jgi:hypothetical protein
MYDAILVNGDSYTARVTNPVWADHLSRSMNKPLYNIAFPGSSNQRIVRSTIQQVHELQQKNIRPLVIIGWSFVRRQEVWYYGTDHKINYMIPDTTLSPESKLITLDALLSHGLATVEQKALINSDQEVHKALTDFWTNVWLLSTSLQQLNLPYWFFSAADNTDCPTHCFPYVDKLSLVKHSQQDPCIWRLHEFSLQTWARQHDSGHDTTTGHLSDSGHELFAEVIQKQIEKHAN